MGAVPLSRGDKMSKITVNSPIVPELDKGFVPAALWNREYRKLAASDPAAIDIAITCERSNGAISRFDSKLLEEIEKAEDFLLVLPPHGLDRCNDEEDWVRQEIRCAIEEKRTSFP